MASNKTLEMFIDNFNNNQIKYSTIKPLSKTIDYVEFVEDKDFLEENFDNSLVWYECFLLKKNDKYVGIIQDCSTDLHIFIKEDYRKKTTLISDLNETVLPFLFRTRDKQIVTFANEKVEDYFLNNLNGIKSTGLMEAEIYNNKKLRIDIPEDIDRSHKINMIDKGVYNLKNKFRELINKTTNKKAIQYLIGEDYISKSEYNFMTSEEKKNYSKEDFDKDRVVINPLVKLKSFYCKATKFYSGEEAEKKLRKFIKEL